MAHATPIDITLPEVGDGGTIPVLARWFGSWKISVQRRALSPAELSLAYDREAAGWDRTIHRLGFDDAYAAMHRQALPGEFPKTATRRCVCWMPAWARASSRRFFPGPRPGRSRSKASTSRRAC